MPSPSPHSSQGEASSSSSPVVEVSRTTRNRKAYSCTECRRRKKHCDRRVPGCNQCVLRGTVDLCRWGDERDNSLTDGGPEANRADGKAPHPVIENSQIRRFSQGDRLLSLREEYNVPVRRSRSRSRSPPPRSDWPLRYRVETSHIRGEQNRAPDISREADLVTIFDRLDGSAILDGLPVRDCDERFPMAAPSLVASSHGPSGDGKGSMADRNRDRENFILTELSDTELSMGLRPQLSSPLEQVDTPMTSVSSKTSAENPHNMPPAHPATRYQPFDSALHGSSRRGSRGSLDRNRSSMERTTESSRFTKEDRSSATSGARQGCKKPILTFTQANELYHMYLALANGLLIFDHDLIAGVLREATSAKSPYKSDDTIELLYRAPDTYALLLIVCASALSNMPPTYAITMGLIQRCEQLKDLLREVSSAASKALEHLEGPTIVAIQAHNLFQHNLTAISSVKEHVSLKDRIVREARFLGLDRLGSPEEDEELWRKRDEETLKNGGTLPNPVDMAPAAILPARHWVAHADIMWSADTFRRRDRRARTIGRSHWAFLRAKDWVTSRLSGCYMISVGSYTTSLPRPYPNFEGNIIDAHGALIFEYLEIALQSSRKTTDLVSHAQSTGQVVEYEKILELDAELMEALDGRPPALRPEDGIDPLSTKHESLFVASTLWHRLFVLHRPYLMLSQTNPERYGLSALRSWDYALLTIKTVREASRAMRYWPPLHFRVLQAALVVISHLFIWPHRMTLAQTLAIHDELNWVINNLKALGSQNGSTSIFAGTSDRLEALLSGASRIKRARSNLLSPEDEGCSIGGMAAPWIEQGDGDGPSAIDLSNNAMQHAAQLASQARTRGRTNQHRTASDQTEANRAIENSNTNVAPWTPDELRGEQRSQGLPADSLSSGQPLLSHPALGALDMQLVRLMGEGTFGYQQSIPQDAASSTAYYAFGPDLQQANTVDNQASQTNVLNGNHAAATPGWSNTVYPGLGGGQASTPSRTAASTAAPMPAPGGVDITTTVSGGQQDLWAEIFAYVDAATASLPFPSR